MTGRNVTRRVVEAEEQALSARDRAIVETVSSLGLATGEQLRQLHFRNLQSSRRTAQQALRSLVAREILARLERRVGGARSGSAGFIYALGRVGQRLQNRWRGQTTGRSRRTHEPGGAFVAHRLACTQLFVDLHLAQSAGELTVVQHLAEPDCWRQRIGPFGRPLILKPDAFVEVAVGTRHLHWFVEIDLATESQSVIARKGSAYIDHFRSGAEADVMPRVLWLAPTNSRVQQLSRTLSQLPHPAGRLHLVVHAPDAIKAMKGEQL